MRLSCSHVDWRTGRRWAAVEASVRTAMATLLATYSLSRPAGESRHLEPSVCCFGSRRIIASRKTGVNEGRTNNGNGYPVGDVSKDWQ